MSDTTLNYFLASGTHAERLAFTPTPPSPANAPPHAGYLWYEVDTDTTWSWDSVAVAWVQTGGASPVSGLAVSAGTQSNSTGTMVFSNANGVTFGMSNFSVITASVAAGGAGSLNVSAGTTSNNLTALTFSNGSGVSFGLNGSVITASVAAGGAGSLNVSAGTTSTNLTKLVFSNSGGVSFGLNGSTVTATVATNYLTTAMASNRGTDFVQATAAFAGTNASGTINSTGISVSVAAPGAGGSVNFSAGTTSNNLTAITFSNANGVSFGLNGSTMTASVAAAGGAQTAISGIVASNTTYTSGTVTFSGVGGGVTVNSNTGQRIDISVGAYITTADLSQNSSKYVQNWKLTGNTAGTTSSAQGTDLWFSGGNSLTVSGSSNSIVFSVGNYLTTAMQSNAATLSNINVSGGTTSSNLSAFKLVDSNGVSWSLDTGSKIYATVKTDYLTTAALSGDTTKYVQAWQLTGNTAGTTSSLQGTKLYFSGGNSLTVSGSSNTIVFSVGNYLTTAALSGDSSKYAGTGFTSGGANISLSGTLNTAGLSLSASVGNYLTTAALSGDTTKYAQVWDLTGNTSGTTSSAQGTAWHFSGGANLTISGSSNTLVFSAGTAAPSPVNFSAGTTSGNLGSVVFSNSNAVSFGLSGSTITGSVSTYSTVGTATTVYDVASASSNGTVTRWAAEDHRHAGIGALGISTSGNTSGTTGSVQGTYWFQGGSNVTVSQITSNNGSHTLVISGAIGPATLSTYEPFVAPGLSTVLVGVPTASSASVSVYPFIVDEYVSAGVLNLAASVAFLTLGTSSGRQTCGLAVGLYTLNVSTLSSLRSTSFSYAVTGNNSTYSISQVTQTNYTGYGAMAQTSSAGVNITSGYTGMKLLGIPINSLLSPGNYWLAVLGTNSTSSTNVGLSFSLLGAAQATALSGMAAVGSYSSDQSTGQNPYGRWAVGQGIWTTATNVTMLPASMNMASVSAVGQTYPLIRFWST